jgi:signal transduction histidine kinase
VISRIRANLAANPLLVDTTIALGLTGVSLLTVLGGAEDIGGRDALSIALLLLQTLPLIVRRRWPIPVLVVTLAATTLHASLAPTEAGLTESLGSLVALFTVAEHYERRISIPAALVVLAAFGLLLVTKAGVPAVLSSLVQTELIVLVAWALGDWAQTRRRYGSAIAETARLEAATAEIRADRARQEERERIARELHDIVTHHVSVMVIQAGAAQTALERHPEQTRTALEAIERTGRAALVDMRRMLGILGQASADAGDAGRQPMPDLQRLGALVDEVRAAGLPVELAIEGDAPALDAGVALTVYRVIQEALTNTLKHATGARATVHLRYTPEAVEVEVSDVGGHGQRDLGEAGSGGHGIVGMRERVAVFGGTLEAGPRTGGYAVTARLPLTPSDASEVT